MTATSIVFVVTMSILGFIFVPKIIAHYERKKERKSSLKMNLGQPDSTESSVSNLDNGLKFNLVVSFVCSQKLLQCVPYCVPYDMYLSLSRSHLTPVCFHMNPHNNVNSQQSSERVG